MNIKSPEVLRNAEKFETEYNKKFESGFNFNFRDLFSKMKLNKNKLLYIYLILFGLIIYLLYKSTPEFILKKQIIYFQTNDSPEVDYSELIKYTVIFSAIIMAILLYFGYTNHNLHKLIF
jgi:hypothetical protein